jgi:CCT motif
MFNNNYFTDNYELIDPNLLTADMQFYIPSLDQFSDLSPELLNFPDLDGMEPSNVYQMLDQTILKYTNEFIKYFPNPLESVFSLENLIPTEKTKNSYEKHPNQRFLTAPNAKVGTISIEERRIKVQRFLEKRKRRVYTKKISYLCRKRVADTRERCKGRFVSKKNTENVSR